MTKSKVNTIILHCIGWLLFFSLPVIFITSQSFDGDSFHLSVNIFTLLSISTYIFNLLFSIPTFYSRNYFLNKKRGLYVLSILALLLVVYFLRPYDICQIKTVLEETNWKEWANRPPFAPNHPPPPGSNDRPQPAICSRKLEPARGPRAIWKSSVLL
jgi:hypothetical protein